MILTPKLTFALLQNTKVTLLIVPSGKRGDNKQNSTAIIWKRKFKANPHEDCALKGEVCHKFPENVRLIQVYKSVLKLDLLIGLIES